MNFSLIKDDKSVAKKNTASINDRCVIDSAVWPAIDVEGIGVFASLREVASEPSRFISVGSGLSRMVAVKFAVAHAIAKREGVVFWPTGQLPAKEWLCLVYEQGDKFEEARMFAADYAYNGERSRKFFYDRRTVYEMAEEELLVNCVVAPFFFAIGKKANPLWIRHVTGCGGTFADEVESTIKMLDELICENGIQVGKPVWEGRTQTILAALTGYVKWNDSVLSPLTERTPQDQFLPYKSQRYYQLDEPAMMVNDLPTNIRNARANVEKFRSISYAKLAAAFDAAVKKFLAAVKGDFRSCLLAVEEEFGPLYRARIIDVKQYVFALQQVIKKAGATVDDVFCEKPATQVDAESGQTLLSIAATKTDVYEAIKARSYKEWREAWATSKKHSYEYRDRASLVQAAANAYGSVSNPLPINIPRGPEILNCLDPTCPWEFNLAFFRFADRLGTVPDSLKNRVKYAEIVCRKPHSVLYDMDRWCPVDNAEYVGLESLRACARNPRYTTRYVAAKDEHS